MQSTILWKGVLWECEYDYDPPEEHVMDKYGDTVSPPMPAYAVLYSAKVNGEDMMDFLSDWATEGLEDRICEIEGGV